MLTRFLGFDSLKSMQTYKIPAENLESLKGKIADLCKKLARLAKKGVQLASPEPIVLNVLETVKVPATQKPGIGLIPDRVYYVVEVGGAAPKVAGFEFVAKLQHEDGGTILCTVPTAELGEAELARYRNADRGCDHCGYERNRKDTFVVRNIATRELKQVGRSCLRDFLGHEDPHAIAEYAEYLMALDAICGDHEEGGSFSGRIQDTGDLVTFLTYVAEAIQRNGWLSRGKARLTYTVATADIAMNLGMFPTKEVVERGLRLVVTDADRKLAADCLAWTEARLASDEGLSDYEHNLRVVVLSGIVGPKTIGIAASLVPYYQRAIGVEIERKKAMDSQHFGTVGKREVFKLTVSRIFDTETNFGVTHIHKFLDEQGNVGIWFASNKRLVEGDTYQVKGTVKSHGVRDGIKQTVLTRCAAEKLNK